MKRRKPKPFVLCGPSLIPTRELIAAARIIKGLQRWRANGSPKPPPDREPWRNWGECCGGMACGGDVDGVGSWGRAVRIFEDSR